MFGSIKVKKVKLLLCF